METTDRKAGQAWLWAAAINLVVFILLWFAFAKIPAPGTRVVAAPEAGPGNTFGQMTHLMGNESTPVPEPVISPVREPSAQSEGQWVDEFYLDRGPAVSFAPRLNADGTPRAIPNDQEWVKSPTYEDEGAALSAEDINMPQMNPSTFSKADLPAEFRNANYQLTVRVRIDARGRVVGRPSVIRGSSNPVVDQATIDKIMNEVTFTPGTRKDNGQPVACQTDIPIFWT